MEAILDAAVTVFFRDGLERATTNAIAAEAGISPGSLYQYFSNREEILDAVTDRYLVGLSEIYRRTGDSMDDLDLPLVDLVDLVVDPVLGYKSANSAFGLVYGLGKLPSSTQERVAAAHGTFTQHCVTTLGRRNPGLETEVISRAVRQCTAMFRAMINLLGHVHGDEATDCAETKAVMVAYLDSLGIR